MTLLPTPPLEGLDIPSVTPATRPAPLSASPLVDRARLDAVLRTGLLDTAAEESFDRLTRLAAKLTGVPATFISERCWRRRQSRRGPRRRRQGRARRCRPWWPTICGPR